MWRECLAPVLAPYLGRRGGAPLPVGARRDARTRNRVAARLRDDEAVSEVVRALPAHYDAVRVYHGCRPADVRPYYAHGIAPLDCDAADGAARALFHAAAYPELDPTAIDEAIADVGRDLRAGRVWFCLDARALVRECGHYLVYGSEYLCGVGASLIAIQRRRGRRARDYRDALKAGTTPTLFACDLPWGEMRDVLRRELAETLLEGVAHTLGVADADLEADPERLPVNASGFWVGHAISPGQIAGHTHPERVRDYHGGGGWYRWRDHVALRGARAAPAGAA